MEPGLYSSIGISLGKLGLKSFKAYAESAESCAQRASHLEKDFKSHLNSKGIGNIQAYTNQVSWIPYGKLKERTGAHAWVEVYYEYIDEEGEIHRGVRYYDPWLFTSPVSKTLK